MDTMNIYCYGYDRIGRFHTKKQVNKNKETRDDVVHKPLRNEDGSQKN